ncbi:MAG: M23 family metallopeptidase [Clostridiales bacterium]|nr:M23 family metallopeptidase [Clostridiales bacterium]
MKKLPEDSIFRKKSFFVALYSCVGVVLILAAVISYLNVNNLQGRVDPSENPNAAVNESLNTPLNVPVPADEDLANSPDLAGNNTSQGLAARDQGLTITPSPSTRPPSPSASASIQPDSVTPGDDAAAPSEQVATKKPEKSGVSFDAFEDGNEMTWPVLGEIVMDYSMDHVVYDKTLDQYRTNDNICIAAPAGTPVKATAGGVVKKIENTREDGTAIVIDNGNGWMTTYGQLMDGVLVKEGDVVQAGEVIGGVSNPSVYGVLLGNHVSLKITKDDVAVDPKTILTSLITETQPDEAKQSAAVAEEAY